MSPTKKLKLHIDDSEIGVEHINGQDFFSLTDMVKDTGQIGKCMSNRSTIEYLGQREMLYNTGDFNYPEFGVIKNDSGYNIICQHEHLDVDGKTDETVLML